MYSHFFSDFTEITLVFGITAVYVGGGIACMYILFVYVRGMYV